MRQAQTGVANGMGLARMGLASLAMAVLIAPQASTEMRLALNATVSTQCAIADIDSEAWADGVLRVSAQCNAQSYRIRLISGDTEIDLASVSLVEPGADVRDGSLVGAMLPCFVEGLDFGGEVCCFKSDIYERLSVV